MYGIEYEDEMYYIYIHLLKLSSYGLQAKMGRHQFMTVLQMR